MKKFKFITILLVGFLFHETTAQVVNIPVFNNTNKTREAIFFIYELNSSNDVQTLDNYLSTFEGKIESIQIDLVTQMCILEVKSIDNENLEQIIFQAGFKSFLKSELPPAGYKYVYNEDGTWKLKEI